MNADKFGELIDAILENVSHDRGKATELLAEAIGLLNNSAQNHADFGSVTAKYLEALQRSNEQLVKLANVVGKTVKSGQADLEEFELTSSLRDELYKEIGSDIGDK